MRRGWDPGRLTSAQMRAVQMEVTTILEKAQGIAGQLRSSMDQRVPLHVLNMNRATCYSCEKFHWTEDKQPACYACTCFGSALESKQASYSGFCPLKKWDNRKDA